jgi:hypothetical protein
VPGFVADTTTSYFQKISGVGGLPAPHHPTGLLDRGERGFRCDGQPVVEEKDVLAIDAQAVVFAGFFNNERAVQPSIQGTPGAGTARG